jgi:hypothetical protein
MAATGQAAGTTEHPSVLTLENDPSIGYRAQRGNALRETLHSIAAALPSTDAAFFGPAAAETMPQFALLHHVMYQVERGARGRDEASIREGLALGAQLERVSDGNAAHGFPSVDARHCLRVDDSRFGSTVYTATPAALTEPPPVSSEVLDAAVDAVSGAGFAVNLERGLGLAILCEPTSESTVAFGYSLGALPGTVFTDWTSDPVVLGECLLHEASHSWLNLLLAAEEEQLPSGPFAHSPWKDVERPAFGLIHAAFAFSIVCVYCRASKTSDHSSAETARYCEIREDVERRRVAMARDDVERALTFLRSQQIVELIRDAMDASAAE